MKTNSNGWSQLTYVNAMKLVHHKHTHTHTHTRTHSLHMHMYAHAHIHVGRQTGCSPQTAVGNSLQNRLDLNVLWWSPSTELTLTQEWREWGRRWEGGQSSWCREEWPGRNRWAQGKKRGQ